MSMSEQDQKPALPQPQDDRITLRVRDDNSNEFTFMVRRNTAFKKVFEAFANKVKAKPHAFRFHYDGLRLAEDDSPHRIGLNDDDIIEAFVLAEGGLS